MKIGFLVFCFVVLAAYALNRGVFIGSTVVAADYYYLDCRYLYPSGVLNERLGGWGSETELRATTHCKMFHD